MPRIKNVSGSDRAVPSLGGRVVVNGEVVEVSEDEVYGFTCQESNWKPGDKATQKIHDEAHAAQVEANAPGLPAAGWLAPPPQLLVRASEDEKGSD